MILELVAEWQTLRLMIVVHNETRDTMIFENLHGPGMHRVEKLGNAVSALSAMIADSLLVSFSLCLVSNLFDYAKLDLAVLLHLAEE